MGKGGVFPAGGGDGLADRSIDLVVMGTRRARLVARLDLHDFFDGARQAVFDGGPAPADADYEPLAGWLHSPYPYPGSALDNNSTIS